MSGCLLAVTLLVEWLTGICQGGLMSSGHRKIELHFPCECVSEISGYSDPWAGVAQNKLLPNGTKERILDLLANRPKTVAQLAKELNLAQPTVLRHISEMMASELLRESEEW